MAKIQILGQNRQKITKYLEKNEQNEKFEKIWDGQIFYKIFKKMAQNGPNCWKWPKNGRILKVFVSSFFSPPKKTETGTSHFHATLHSKDNFSSRILNFSNSNFGRTKKWTGEVNFFVSNLFGFASNPYNPQCRMVGWSDGWSVGWMFGWSPS